MDSGRLTVLAVLLTLIPINAQFVTSLRNVTVKKGDTAVLECESAASTLIWMRYLPRPDVIHSDTSGKFITRNTSLVINNADVSDGLPYSCLAIPGDNQPRYANLVVIDSPEASFDPVSAVSSGENVSFSCSLTYGGPTHDNPIYVLSSSQDPTISIYIGNQDLTSVARSENMTSSITRTKTLSVSHIVTKNNAKNTLQCRVTSANPVFNYTVEKIFPLIDSPTTVTIDLVTNSTDQSDDTVYVGTMVNCSADGTPIPLISWVSVTLNPASELVETAPGYSVLKLQGPGVHIWNCTATNAPNHMAYKVVNFTVIEVPVIPVEIKSYNILLGLGIACGCLILIGVVIVIIIVWLKKRQKYNGYGAPKVMSAKAKLSGPTSPVSSVVLRHPPLCEPPSMKELMGLEYSVNPNPVYETSVMYAQTTSPQKRFSDEPGYGDLGVRNLGASGSMPRLNESFDSMAERNYKKDRSYSNLNPGYQDERSNVSHAYSGPEERPQHIYDSRHQDAEDDCYYDSGRKNEADKVSEHYYGNNHQDEPYNYYANHQQGEPEDVSHNYYGSNYNGKPNNTSGHYNSYHYQDEQDEDSDTSV